MASSSARIFFAGVATTFLILALGFGGGLLMANSALKESAYQSKSRVEQVAPARVILPTTAQAAEVPNPLQSVQQVSAAQPAAPPPSDPVDTEKKAEKVDIKKAETEARERRKRYAERKAKREAARARQQMEPKIRTDGSVLAFRSDGPRGFGFFGN